MQILNFHEKTAKLIKEVDPISDNLIKTTLPLQDKSYEVLEFLGDAVIHNVLARYLYKNYHGFDWYLKGS